jgi:hypothetical protein
MTHHFILDRVIHQTKHLINLRNEPIMHHFILDKVIYQTKHLISD